LRRQQTESLGMLVITVDALIKGLADLLVEER
jgi:hypothetical protein